MTTAIPEKTGPPDLVEVTEDGRMRLHLHPGQLKAWRSKARFIAILAGTQGGKTAFGPHWLRRGWKLDENGEPLEEIEDKSAFDHMDAERYILSRLRGRQAEPTMIFTG